MFVGINDAVAEGSCDGGEGTLGVSDGPVGNADGTNVIVGPIEVSILGGILGISDGPVGKADGTNDTIGPIE